MAKGAANVRRPARTDTRKGFKKGRRANENVYSRRERSPNRGPRAKLRFVLLRHYYYAAADIQSPRGTCRLPRPHTRLFLRADSGAPQKESRMRRYIAIAVGLGLLLVVLNVTNAGPALAQGALKPISALIVNDSANPVPVTVIAAPAQTRVICTAGLGRISLGGRLPTASSGYQILRLCALAVSRASTSPVSFSHPTSAVVSGRPPGS
jgi:hypothetical protein